MEYISKVTLDRPRTLAELTSMLIEKPESELIAGGTHIMSRPDYFPKSDFHSYISLDKVQELHRVSHTDKFLELGSMQTIQNLLNTASTTLSPDVYNAISRITSTPLKSKITIGGSLCLADSRTTLCSILAAVKAEADVRFITVKGDKKAKIHSRWMPVYKLYDSNGRYLYSDANTVLTRIRIPSAPNSTFIYDRVGSITNGSDHFVSVTIEFTLGQTSIITNPSFCLSFLKNGFYFVQGFDSFLSALKFPLESEDKKKIALFLSKHLPRECPAITPLQLERALRLTLNATEKVNRLIMDQ